MDSRSGANLGQAHFLGSNRFEPIWDRHFRLPHPIWDRHLKALEPIWDRHISLAPTDLGQALSVAVE